MCSRSIASSARNRPVSASLGSSASCAALKPALSFRCVLILDQMCLGLYEPVS